MGGLTPIEDCNEQIGGNCDDREFDTSGGLVVQAFGRLPRRGERRDIGDFRFTVLNAGRRRVHLLRATVAGR